MDFLGLFGKLNVIVISLDVLLLASIQITKLALDLDFYLYVNEEEARYCDSTSHPVGLIVWLHPNDKESNHDFFVIWYFVEVSDFLPSVIAKHWNLTPFQADPLDEGRSILEVTIIRSSLTDNIWKCQLIGIAFFKRTKMCETIHQKLNGKFTSIRRECHCFNFHYKF